MKRHEARENVRLTEIAKPPGHERDDADECRVVEGIEYAGRCRLLRGDSRRVPASHGRDGDGRHDQKREEHHDALHRVGPADAEKAADRRIGKDTRRADDEGDAVVEGEDLLEENGTRDKAGRCVDREEDEDDESTRDTQHPALVGKAVLEIVRNGERVARDLGVAAQASRDKAPVDECTGDEAHGDPYLVETGHVDRAGQAKHQPAAHVRGAGRQRRDGAAELASTENVVLEIGGVAIGRGAET